MYYDSAGVHRYRHYATLDDFVAGWLRVIRLSYYAPVLTAARVVYDSLDAKVRAECFALGASPWAASKYTYAGVEGGILVNVWTFYLQPLVPPEPFGLGVNVPPPAAVPYPSSIAYPL
jgi:hypothetical protein